VITPGGRGQCGPNPPPIVELIRKDKDGKEEEM